MNILQRGFAYFFNMTSRMEEFEENAIYDSADEASVTMKPLPQKKRPIEPEPKEQSSSSSQEVVQSSESEEKLVNKVVDSDEEDEKIRSKKKKTKIKVHKVVMSEEYDSKIHTINSGRSRLAKTKRAKIDTTSEKGRVLFITPNTTYNNRLYANKEELFGEIKRRMKVKSIDAVRLAQECPEAYWNAVHFFGKDLKVIEKHLVDAGLCFQSVVEDGVVKRRSGRLRK